MLVWLDMKLCIPDSESVLWIWKSPCAELKVLPLAWKKTFEEWSISTTGNVALESEVEFEKDGTLITRSISTTGNVASEAVGEKEGTLIPRFISMAMNNRLNLILNLFLFQLFLIFRLTWLTSYRISKRTRAPSVRINRISTSSSCFLLKSSLTRKNARRPDDI